MKTPFALLLVSVLLTAGLPATAQIYKWTDANGKVHYSDRKPADDHSEDVSERLGPVNVTDSEPTQEPGEQLPETEAERIQKQNEQREQARVHAARMKQCAKARDRLRKLSGPVYFEREDGSTFTITEEQRAEQEQQLRQAIERYCD